LYLSSNYYYDTIKKYEIEVTDNMYGEEEKCVESFGGETGSKRHLGRTRHSLETGSKRQLGRTRHSLDDVKMKQKGGL
jgi:hypothetical protein